MWSYVISVLSGIVGITYVLLPECTTNKDRRQRGGRNPQKTPGGAKHHDPGSSQSLTRWLEGGGARGGANGKGRSQSAAGINSNVPIKQLELSRLSDLSLAQDHF